MHLEATLPYCVRCTHRMIHQATSRSTKGDTYILLVMNTNVGTGHPRTFCLLSVAFRGFAALRLSGKMRVVDSSHSLTRARLALSPRPREISLPQIWRAQLNRCELQHMLLNTVLGIVNCGLLELSLLLLSRCSETDRGENQSTVDI